MQVEAMNEMLPPLIEGETTPEAAAQTTPKAA